jgi:hypothetical protein
VETKHAITRFGAAFAERPPCTCLTRFFEGLTIQEQGGVKMLRKDFVLHKTKTLLSEFLGPIIANTDKPRQKFLRQTIGAILLSGCLVVKELTRWIHDDCSDLFYRLKRLVNHLVSPSGDLAGAVAGYRQSLRPYISADTPLVIDITDLAKPRAKRMEYLANVYDGSEHKLVPGYWCLEVYAHLKHKRVLPVAMDVYSIDDPAVGSRNLQIERTIEAVNKAVNGNGVWIGDRDFDALNLYEIWLSRNCHFVVRQRGDRHVVTPNGVHILQRDLAEHLRQQFAQANADTDTVYCKVCLPDNPKALYLVANWRVGKDEPLILSTTLVVENQQQAKQIVWYYKQRWLCEEASGFLKSQIGLERFCIRRYRAIQRLLILAMLAMGFLTWVLLRSRRLVKALYSFTSRFRKQPQFVYYRLLEGLQQFARLRLLRLTKTSIQPLKNG